MATQRSSSTVSTLDELGMQTDASMAKVFSLDETVLLSTKAIKYNKDLKEQERIIIVTSKAIYNAKQDFISTISSFLPWSKTGTKVQRRIDLDILSGVSISTLGTEFVLHVKKEYDYRFSAQKRDKIIVAIYKAYHMHNEKGHLPIFLHSTDNLNEVTTTEYDKKQGISRFPRNPAKISNEESLLENLSQAKVSSLKFLKNSLAIFDQPISDDKSSASLEDFTVLKVLGRGMLGKVQLVENKHTKELYAMKSIHKEEVINSRQIENIKTERYLLERGTCPFVARIDFAFQTDEKLYFVMPFMSGGDLYHHLRKAKRFDEKRAKFYTAELVISLQYIHSLGAVYRDIKPENVLMDADGHLCLTDFGASKLIKDYELTYSIIGTNEYMAPEIIQETGHNKSLDWWTLGVLTFEMLHGIPPFYNRQDDVDKLYADIAFKDVVFSQKLVISNEAKDFIKRTLAKDPTKRLGANGASEIKKHPWFADIDWEKLAQKKITPLYKPEASDGYDVKHFDKEFTNETAMHSVILKPNKQLLDEHRREFDDFEYRSAQQEQQHKQNQ